MRESVDYAYLTTAAVFTALLIWSSINNVIDWLSMDSCEVVLVDRTLHNKEVTITVSKLLKEGCEVKEMKAEVLED